MQDFQRFAISYIIMLKQYSKMIREFHLKCMIRILGISCSMADMQDQSIYSPNDIVLHWTVHIRILNSRKDHFPLCPVISCAEEMHRIFTKLSGNHPGKAVLTESFFFFAGLYRKVGIRGDGIFNDDIPFSLL